MASLEISDAEWSHDSENGPDTTAQNVHILLPGSQEESWDGLIYAEKSEYTWFFQYAALSVLGQCCSRIFTWRNSMDRICIRLCDAYF